MKQDIKSLRSLAVSVCASALLGLTLGAIVLMKAVPANTTDTPPDKQVAAKTDKAVSRAH